MTSTINRWIQAECVQFGQNALARHTERKQQSTTWSALFEVDENKLFLPVIFVVTIVLMNYDRLICRSEKVQEAASISIVQKEVDGDGDACHDNEIWLETVDKTEQNVIVPKTTVSSIDLSSGAAQKTDTAEPDTPIAEPLADTPIAEPLADTPIAEPLADTPIAEPLADTQPAQPDDDEPILVSEYIEYKALPTPQNAFKKAYVSDKDLQAQLTSKLESELLDVGSTSESGSDTDFSPLIRLPLLQPMVKLESANSSVESHFLSDNIGKKPPSQDNLAGGASLSSAESPKVKELIEIFENYNGVDTVRRLSSNGSGHSKSGETTHSSSLQFSKNRESSSPLNISSSPLREFSDNITMLGLAKNSQSYTEDGLTTPTKDRGLGVTSIGLMTRTSTKGAVTTAINETPTKGSISYFSPSK